MTDILDNNFFKGGIGVALVGVAAVLLRQIPARLWALIVRQFTVHVEIHSDSPLFDRVVNWLDSLPQIYRARSLVAKANIHYFYVGNKEFGVLFSPASGVHVLRVEKKFILFNRSRQVVVEAGQSGTSNTKAAETISFRYIGRSQNFGRRVVSLVMDHYEQRRFQVQTVCHYRPMVWSANQRALRTLDSVILPEGVAESVESDLERFLASKAEYNALRIPYQRVYIFHGAPGSGKTSLTAAIAGRFGLTIYNLNFQPHIEIEDMLAPISPKSLIVAEDIDAVYDGRTVRNKNGGMEFSTFLNVLDGFRSKEEAIVILTTNHLDKLDPAIVRRANMKIRFDNAEAGQARRLFLRFFPGNAVGAERFVCRGTGAMMSDLQGWLIANRDDAVIASEYVHSEGQ